MVVATVALRSSTLFYELALDRVVQIKQLRAAQALAYYGVAYCKQMKNHNVSQTISFDCWPPEGPYEGKIEIEPTKKGYTVEATMSKEDLKIHTIQIEIANEKDGWRMETMKQPKNSSPLS